jgi:uncharacterized membrane protein
MAVPVLLVLVKFLHDLFTSIWIGGLIVLGITVLPAINKTLNSQPEKEKATEAIRSRLSILIYISIIGLLITGILLSNRSPLFLGYFTIANEYSFLLTLKHSLIGIMVVFTITRSQVVPRLTTLKVPTKKKLNGGLLFANIILGILVLFFSAYTATLTLVTPIP